jgi:hypothetical protein
LCAMCYEQQRIVIIDRSLCSCFETQERAQREKLFYYVFILFLIWLLSSMLWFFSYNLRWHAPKFLVRLKTGPTMLKSRSSWNLVPLLASNTKRGKKACWKFRD